MIRKSDNFTVVILSEEEAKELSVRYSLRCICRDCWVLCRVLARRWRNFYRIYARGTYYKNHWWMQIRR